MMGKDEEKGRFLATGTGRMSRHDARLDLLFTDREEGVWGCGGCSYRARVTARSEILGGVRKESSTKQILGLR